MNPYDLCDINRLKEAAKILNGVYDYYFGALGYAGVNKKLLTAITKLEAIIAAMEEERRDNGYI